MWEIGLRLSTDFAGMFFNDQFFPAPTPPPSECRWRHSIPTESFISNPLVHSADIPRHFFTYSQKGGKNLLWPLECCCCCSPTFSQSTQIDLKVKKLVEVGKKFRPLQKQLKGAKVVERCKGFGSLRLGLHFIKLSTATLSLILPGSHSTSTYHTHWDGSFHLERERIGLPTLACTWFLD